MFAPNPAASSAPRVEPDALAGRIGSVGSALFQYPGDALVALPSCGTRPVDTSGYEHESGLLDGKRLAHANKKRKPPAGFEPATC